MPVDILLCVSVDASLLDEEDNVFVNVDQLQKGGGKKKIEEMYQRKSPLEHILLRPDTYIGSVEFTEPTQMWVYDEEQEKLVQKNIVYVPGLYKIFDEILVNAADNKQRDPKMNVIKVDINRKDNKITIYNNGKGIPVAMHKTEQMYVPELIFGTLLTSSNYDDSERKVTGGRNGYGAKLCNIFSTKFTLETSSKEYKKAFKQTWINNMTKDEEPQIGKAVDSDYTKITFKPDLAKFKMTELDDDIVGLMSRRAYDVAGSSKGVKVYLNGKLLPVQGFKQYVEQYTKDVFGPDNEPVKVVYDNANPRWEIALCVSDKGFQQVSFVNSIATTKGGRHVDYIADQITSLLVELIKKKFGAKSNVNVKNHMWVFVNSLIENPTFDSQTKETMTLQSKSFGSKCEITEKFMKQTIACGIVDAVMSWVKFKQQEEMNKKCSGKKTTKLKGIPKLEDANEAGTKNSMQCTLILTEGDSAKTLAVSGLGVVGRDKYGVFPLRGKLLNVRDGNLKQIQDNIEINALIKILGLQYRKKYDTDEDMKSLRYGKVMIMADQDQDGSHIKGLVINFIHHNWPSLVRRNFVEEFITPIVKATKGKEELSFFSIPEYNEWRENADNWKTYKIKYYKGLGTSTSKEAKEYFSDMARHRIRFRYAGQDDDSAVDLAFSKKKIEERKEWLTRWMQEKKDRRTQGLPEEYLYNKDTRAVSYSEFINKELVLFSNTDNERSIPSLVDGFKPGQRKVLFACFKRADKREVKVAQLAGAVAELSAYHHGEQSLMGTIVNLAQDFVGSNNVNVLLPIGQFGTRLQGGKDSASPRYIFTQLNPVTRSVFPQADDNVLRFLFEENQRIEPEWYCPIIPMVLVNGASGIGTGWSTNIPNYNPRDLAENMRRLIRGDDPKPMKPWYKHFRGEIEQLDNQRYVCYGEIARLNDDTIEITELPVKTWTQAYKEAVLEPMMEGNSGGEKEKGKKQEALITDFKEYHTDMTVRFVVKVAKGKMRALETEGLHKVFKLQFVINTTSMVLFDAAGCLKKYNSPEEVCTEFFETRKSKYVERKKFLVGMLKAQSNRLSNQARFIMAKIKGEISIENRRKANIVDQLIKMNFDPDPVKKWREEQKKKELKESGETEVDLEETLADVEEDEDGKKIDKKLETHLSDYDYLVGMALIKLSEEEKDKLLAESGNKLKEVKDLEVKTWGDLWEGDLERFLEELKKQEDKEKADMEMSIKNAAKKFGKDEKPSKKKACAFAAEVLPSKDGERIEPVIDKSLKEKYEKMGQPKKERVKKEPAEPKKPKKEGTDIKQFLEKKKETPPKKKKRDEWNSDESSPEESGGEFENTAFDDDNSGDDVVEVMPKAKPRGGRAPPKRVSDSSKENDQDMDTAEFDEGESRDNAVEKEEDREPENESSNSMPPAQSKKTAPAKPKPKQPKEDAPKRAKKSKKVFDSDDSMDDFIVDSGDSDFDKPKKKKTVAKRKKNSDDSDDEFEPEEKKPAKKQAKKEKEAPKRKKANSSDESADEFEFREEEKKQKEKAPAPKKVKKIESDDDDVVALSDDESTKKTSGKSKAKDSDDDDEFG
ncbi:hypothetical protein WR25_09079 isoform B [Diploscapter pachys]|uniref:DNA topoisomerase 2 n=1 Tax=Diploscapter pachys TaxID=2018661 RepID=A0A2A2JN06_9BILA|nr:hypothetical protein WR25_09079 isoform B [Diploscapter pachys]